MSHLRKLLLAVLASVGLMGTFGASGYAYLGQYQYDDSWPTATYDGSGHTCASTAYTPAGYKINVTYGTLELRYSPGCSTAWARFTCTSPNPRVGYCNFFTLRIQRDNPDGAVIDDYVTDGTNRGNSVYYLQVNDLGSFRAKACWWYYQVGGCTADW
jgi:hypothetical protein